MGKLDFHIQARVKLHGDGVTPEKALKLEKALPRVVSLDGNDMNGTFEVEHLTLLRADYDDPTSVDAGWDNVEIHAVGEKYARVLELVRDACGKEFTIEFTKFLAEKHARDQAAIEDKEDEVLRYWPG